MAKKGAKPEALPAPEPEQAPVVPPLALPACVLNDPASLALLYRVQMVGDLPADSYDDAWDALPDPNAYAPSDEAQDWLRANWELLIEQGEITQLHTTNAPAREEEVQFARTWMKAFLTSFRINGVVVTAAADAGMHTRSVYNAKERDPQFAAAWKVAEAESADRLEAEAFRRAHDGCEEAVYGSAGGGMGTVEVGRVLKYSDALMIKLLNARRPEKFREPKIQVSATANSSANASATATAENTPEQLQRLQDRKRRRLERAAAGGIIVPLAPPAAHADGNN